MENQLIYFMGGCLVSGLCVTQKKAHQWIVCPCMSDDVFIAS